MSTLCEESLQRKIFGEEAEGERKTERSSRGGSVECDDRGFPLKPCGNMIRS